VSPGDNIIAVFYASNQSKVMISSYYELEGTRELQMETAIVDDCPGNSLKVYNLSLPSEQADNASIRVKVLKYSGNPILQVSSSYTTDLKTINSIKMLETATYQSFMQVQISSKLRKELNITGQVYLYITSVFDSTYGLIAVSGYLNYNILYTDMPEISILEGEDIDNYFFWYALPAELSDEEVEVTIRGFELAEKFEFAVRLCEE
jgi:hypothetical protein